MSPLVSLILEILSPWIAGGSLSNENYCVDRNTLITKIILDWVDFKHLHLFLIKNRLIMDSFYQCPFNFDWHCFISNAFLGIVDSSKLNSLAGLSFLSKMQMCNSQWIEASMKDMVGKHKSSALCLGSPQKCRSFINCCIARDRICQCIISYAKKCIM